MDALEYAAQRRSQFLDELCDFLRIPSISADPAYGPDVARAAHFVAAQLRRSGLENVALLPTEGHPAVYGEWLGAPGRPTVLVYGHYDVQPVDPLAEWTTPPFEPSIRQGAIYARGASDDKGQVFLHWKAVEALLAARGRLPANAKFLVEGEEECASTHLGELLARERARLAADFAVVSDTAMFDRGVPAICYGLRGLVYWEVEVQGPAVDLHSGRFGGAVANPAGALAQLLAGLKDARGAVAVPGFYDRVRPLTAEERARFAALPFDEERLRRKVGAPALTGEEGYTTLERLWVRPALDIHGLFGGYAGPGAKTVLPARAGAKLSCRLVPDQDPDEVAALVERQLAALCPPGVALKVNRLASARPWVMDLKHPALAAAGRALEAGFGRRPVFIRAGGSVPVVPLLGEVMGVPVLMVGFGLPDDGAHGPNERFELANFVGGLAALIHLWDELAAAL